MQIADIDAGLIEEFYTTTTSSRNPEEDLRVYTRSRSLISPSPTTVTSPREIAGIKPLVSADSPP